jgi:hypothetical protein
MTPAEEETGTVRSGIGGVVKRPAHRGQHREGRPAQVSTVGHDAPRSL